MAQHLEVVVPDGMCGIWKIESFTVSEKDSESTRISAAVRGYHAYVPPGDYKKLVRGSTVVMSNTSMEIRTNMGFIDKAHGNVLINGLGLGMVLAAILKKPEVTHVTVVEASQEVIDLTGPSFRDDPRVTIVHADALEYQPPKGVRYDVVWHDIWDYICADNLEDMKRLHRKYGRRAAWQGSWCRDHCEAHQQDYNRSRW